MLPRDDLIDELPGLYRFAVSLVRDDHLAADLVQDTIERALRTADRFDPSRPAGPWLRRILHNLAVDRMRRSEHEMSVAEVEDDWRRDEYTVDPATVAQRTLDREELEDALVRIPFSHRAVVLLHDVEGFTVRDVAESLGIGLPAAKQRLRRGRMALVSALAAGAERRRLLTGVPMRCWDARRHVSDLLDGTRDQERTGLVTRHLEICPTCPPLFAALTGAHRALEELRDSDSVIPPDVRAVVEAKIP